VSDVDDARKRVRQLLLSGDNTLKHRDDAVGAERARARFEEALAVAEAAGLEDGLIEIIRRRLEPDGQADGA
jgi:hypothetical protein